MEITEEILGKLHTDTFARSVFWNPEVDSTNLWAKRAAVQGEDNGSLFVADAQTAGRGSRGRSWESPAKTALYMSLLLTNPQIKPENASMLTLVMGLSVAEAVEKLSGLQGRIKWPNDVVLSKKKICGILTEMSAGAAGISHIIIGVGINLMQKVFPEELSDKATSLYMETGREISRADMAAGVMDAFERNYTEFCKTQDMSGLKEAYESVLINLGQPVLVLDPAGEYEGISQGIDSRGELLVKRQDGTLATVYSGEVSVRGLYSYV